MSPDQSAAVDVMFISHLCAFQAPAARVGEVFVEFLIV